jgi:hypothetical protein
MHLWAVNNPRKHRHYIIRNNHYSSRQPDLSPMLCDIQSTFLPDLGAAGFTVGFTVTFDVVSAALDVVSAALDALADVALDALADAALDVVSAA